MKQENDRIESLEVTIEYKKTSLKKLQEQLNEVLRRDKDEIIGKDKLDGKLKNDG